VLVRRPVDASAARLEIVCAGRSDLFGTPVVWRNGNPLVWKVRERVFRRYCRPWWNVQPHKALLHGMDPFWAGLEESGGIPENAVVCPVALGLDGLDLGAARHPPRV